MAPAALILWPPITIILFAILGAPRGLIWSVIVGYLFLPENYFVFDLPGVSFDKSFTISFSAVLATLIFHRRRDPDIHIFNVSMRNVIFFLLAVLVLVSPIGTLLTNPEMLENGPTIRPGLTPRDIPADIADTLIRFAPLLLAWRLLTRPEHHRELLIAILVMAFVYTFLVLFERRMSPQLNVWIYGYFPHNWIQHVRGGGFRPLVFMRHGIWLGFFLFTAVIAALALSRDPAVRKRALLPFVALWILIVLFLSRNMGASMLALLFAPLVLLATFSFLARNAQILALLILFYPALHHTMEEPMNLFVEFVSSISEERAQSFQVRLDNEAELVARANEKPLFGWGGWGRMRIINEYGRDTSLVDGAWVVQKGKSGWVGYIGFFGILVLPVIFAARAARRKPISPAVGGMMAIMAGNFLYIIPNSTINPIAMLMLGALAAFAQYDLIESEATESAQAQEPKKQVLRYTRFGPDDPRSGARATSKVSAETTTRPSQGSRPHSRPVSMSYSSRSRRKSDS